MISSIYSTAIPLTQAGKRKGRTKNEIEAEYSKRLEKMSGIEPRFKKAKSVAKTKCKIKKKSALKLQQMEKKAERRRQFELERSRQERIRLFGSDLLGVKPQSNP